MPPRARGEVTPHIVALTLYCVGTLVFYAGMLSDLDASIGPPASDALFNFYLLKWGSFQLSQGLPDFWNAPFYYPTPNVVAMSDHLLGPAIGFHILRVLGVSSLAAYNLLVLLTFPLGGWTAYWVLRRSGLSWTGAVIGGWIFAFSAYRFGTLVHYQVIRMQWIPLTVWSFDRLLARPTPTRAAAFLAFYALHVSGGAYLAYLVHVVLIILLVNRWVGDRAPFREPRNWAVWVATAALTVGILAFFYSGYLAEESTLSVGQSSDSVRRGGVTLQHYLPAPLKSPLGGPSRRTFFPGLVALSLVGAGCWSAWRRFAIPRREGARALPGTGLAIAGGAVALVGLILADGFTRSGDRLVDSLAGIEMNGYLPPLLVVLAGTAVVVWGLRSFRGGPILRWKEMPLWPRGLLVSGAAMLALSLPVFFSVTATLLPGMQGMRVSHRALAFVALPLAYLAGLGWDRIRPPLRSSWRYAPAALALVLVFESRLAVAEIPRHPLPAEADFPSYAHWIADHPEVGAYLELPLGRRPSGETLPMYFQTLHWRPLCNGFSARRPPSFWEVIRMCRPFPDVEGIRSLAARGTTHIVVHWRPLPWQRGRRVRPGILRKRPRFEGQLQRYGARLVFAEGDTVIYDIRPEVSAPPPTERDSP